MSSVPAADEAAPAAPLPVAGLRDALVRQVQDHMLHRAMQLPAGADSLFLVVDEAATACNAACAFVLGHLDEERRAPLLQAAARLPDLAARERRLLQATEAQILASRGHP